MTRLLCVVLVLSACAVPIRQEARPSTDGCVEIWEVDENWWPAHEHLVMTICDGKVSAP